MHYFLTRHLNNPSKKTRSQIIGKYINSISDILELENGPKGRYIGAPHAMESDILPSKTASQGNWSNFQSFDQYSRFSRN
ncbi:hypothetical protein AYI69_g8706 [Smittium culicis]|uniref:Uncharacterized protein n=1 Tax=Smittium culicis TaxID=133412 RepID=A0A1R1XHV6_9FUNG|nr:hypothetical protein AYI69_g8706 [Smittium culicis]